MSVNDYDLDALNRSLLPPPRIWPAPENWPVFEPPFRDHRPPYEQEAEEWEAVESSEIAEGERMVLADEMLARVREAVLGSERLQRLLADRRYIPIGATLQESKDPDSPPTILYVIYDYDTNQAIEVTLDRSLEITNLANLQYQPAPLQEEIDRAIELARQHDRLAARLTDDLTGMAILITVDDPQDPRYNHRLFDIRFGCRDERLPRFSALVDLSTETVISAGALDAPCGGNDDERVR